MCWFDFLRYQDPDYQLMPSDLEAWEQKHGKIPDDAIMLVFNDWGKHWPDKRTYLGTDTKNTSLLHFPGKYESREISKEISTHKKP